MKNIFKNKKIRKAFSAGWYCGYWGGENNSIIRFKKLRYLTKYSNSIEFILGYQRGCNDLKMIRGVENESLRIKKSQEIEGDFIRLSKRFGNSRSQQNN